MVDFASNFTITKIGLKNSTFYMESVVLESRSSTNMACQSERSLRYFHLGRISDLLSIDRSSSHMLIDYYFKTCRLLYSFYDLANDIHI